MGKMREANSKNCVRPRPKIAQKLLFQFRQESVLERQKARMAKHVRHELQLFADTHNLFDFKAVLFRKTHKALFCPERLVVDIQNAQSMFAFVGFKITEIPCNHNLENILDSRKFGKETRMCPSGVKCFLQKLIKSTGSFTCSRTSHMTTKSNFRSSAYCS